MTVAIPHPVLKGAKALVVGIANDSSIAYGCAHALHELGAHLATLYARRHSGATLYDDGGINSMA